MKVPLSRAVAFGVVTPTAALLPYACTPFGPSSPPVEPKASPPVDGGAPGDGALEDADALALAPFCTELDGSDPCRVCGVGRRCCVGAATYGCIDAGAACEGITVACLNSRDGGNHPCCLQGATLVVAQCPVRITAFQAGAAANCSSSDPVLENCAVGFTLCNGGGCADGQCVHAIVTAGGGVNDPRLGVCVP